MADYSGKPLRDKLGLKASMNVWFHALPSSVADKLGLADVTSEDGALDYMHAFVTHSGELDEIYSLALQRLRPNGMLWLCWPKKAAKVATDLNENVIRDVGLAAGLVDVKVCAVDETWSGLKFVRRLKDR